jgi:hypothetical protein
MVVAFAACALTAFAITQVTLGRRRPTMLEVPAE